MIDRLLGPLGQIAASYGIPAEAQDELIQLFLGLQGETIGLLGSIGVVEVTASDPGDAERPARPQGGVGLRDGADSTQSWVHTAVEEHLVGLSPALKVAAE